MLQARVIKNPKGDTRKGKANSSKTIIRLTIHLYESLTSQQKQKGDKE